MRRYTEHAAALEMSLKDSFQSHGVHFPQRKVVWARDGTMECVTIGKNDSLIDAIYDGSRKKIL